MYFPGHILPHGVLTSDDMDMGQKELALFATFHAVQRWRYTRDLAFAREQHNPFLSLGVPQASLRHLPCPLGKTIRWRFDGWSTP